MESTVYSCDGCGVPKKESNHWYFVRLGSAFHIYRWGSFIEGGSDGSVLIRHFCGHACVQKKLSEWMGETVEIKGA